MGAGPVAAGEGKGVDVGLQVDLSAWIAVVPPGPADASGHLEDREVGNALTLQGHGRGDAAEAGSDDGDPGGPGCGAGRSRRGVHGAVPYPLCEEAGSRLMPATVV